MADPGSGYDDPPDERRGWWQPSQSPGERIARCEAYIEGLTKDQAGLKKTLELLGEERREAGRQLLSTIERNQQRTDDKLDALDKRLDFIEQERSESKHFRRKITGFAGATSVVVGIGWSVGTTVWPWIVSLFIRGGSNP